MYRLQRKDFVGMTVVGERRFEQLLLDQGVLSPQELASWRAHQAQNPSASLAKALIDDGRLSPERLQALRRQIQPDTRRDPASGVLLGSLSPKTRYVAPPNSAALRSIDSSREFMPRQIGPYRIDFFLGQGGMGAVYRAIDPQGRAVALKLIRQQSADQRARFERERRLLAKLSETQGFVPILDAGDGPQGPYLALELMEGGSLRDRLDGRPWKASKVYELLKTLARAIGRAHDQGIVHRDLKPANVLFDGEGQPRITDLGLAKHFERGISGATHTASLTAQGELMGTPVTMAPEQISDAKNAGPAADVYALGVIAYEALTGRLPFMGANSVELLMQVTRGRAAPVRELRPDCPPELAAVVERCLQREPAKRYADGLILAEALTEAERAPPPKTRRWPLVLALALPLLIGAWLLSSELALGPKPKPPQITAEPKAAKAKPAAPKPAAPKALDPEPPPSSPGPIGGLALVGALNDGDWGPRPTGLAVSADGRRLFCVDERGAALRALPEGRLLWRLETPGLAFQARFSPDGSRVAAVGINTGKGLPAGWLRLWSEDGALLREDRHPSEVFQSLDFDEQGGLVASAGAFLLRYAGDGADPVRLRGPGRQLINVVWNKTSRAFLALNFRGEAVDLTGAGPLKPLSIFGESLDGLGIGAATPDRRQLFVGLKRGAVHELGVIDLRRGLYTRLQPSRLSPGHIGCDARGERVAWTQGPNIISLADRRGDVLLNLKPPSGVDGGITGLVMEPDGRHLIIGTGVGRLLRYALVEASDALRAAPEPSPIPEAYRSLGGGRLVLDRAFGEETGGRGAVQTAAALTPDENYLVAGGAERSLRIWDLKTGRQAFAFDTGFETGVEALALSPNGTRVVASRRGAKGDGGTVKVWDLWTGRELADLSAPQDWGRVFPRYSATLGRIVIATARGLRSHDAASFALVNTRVLSQKFSAMNIAPDGRRALLCSLDARDNIRSVDLEDLRDIAVASAGSPCSGQMAFTRDGYVLLACIYGRLARWRLDPLRVEKESQIYPPSSDPASPPRRLRDVALIGDGSQALVVGDTGQVVRVETASLRPVNSAAYTVKPGLRVLTFRDARRFLVTAGDGRAHLWDFQNGELWPRRLHSGAVKRLELGPRGRKLLAINATLIGGEAVLWDLATGQARVRFPISGQAESAFARDGSRLAVGGLAVPLGQIRGWLELRSWRGQLIRPIETLPTPVEALSFDPSGRLLVACRGGELRCYDGDGAVIATARLAAGSILEAAWLDEPKAWLILGAGGRSWLWSPEAAEPRSIAPYSRAAATTGAFDGEELFFFASGPALKRYDYRGGKSEFLASLRAPAAAFSVSRSGQKLAWWERDRLRLILGPMRFLNLEPRGWGRDRPLATAFDLEGRLIIGTASGRVLRYTIQAR